MGHLGKHKLSKQVDFYSSDTFAEFAKSFIPNLKKFETWVVTVSIFLILSKEETRD